MGAYPAVLSLKWTIHRLLNSSRISLKPPSGELLRFAYEKVKSLQDFLEERARVGMQRFFERQKRSEREKAKVLEGDLREAVWKLEDALEFHVSTQIMLSQSQTHPLEEFSVDLEELNQVIECFSETAQKMAEEYAKELDSNSSEDEDEDEDEEDDGQAVVVSGGNMVGFTDIFGEIRDALIEDRPQVISVAIAGMAGIGKTTLAKKLLEDPLIKQKFERCIFVQVGQNPQPKKVLQAIVAQVNPGIDKMLMLGKEELYEYLAECLDGRKYLIVLDDVWDGRFWFDLRRRVSDGSMILVTTRMRYIGGKECDFHMPFMNKDESWDLLRGKLFDDGVCPPQLEKAGRKIAQNCEGLPLLIVTIADLLSKADMTLEHWNWVGADKQNSIFEEAYDQLLEVLYPSYIILNQEEKALFLYMSVFPQNYEIRHSRLIKLLSAEEFLDIYRDKHFLGKSLDNLVNFNVVMGCPDEDHKIVEVCSFHSVFWHLSRKEAGTNKFHHTLNRYADGLQKSMEGQRRLSIYRNVLLGIKDVYNSVASVSNARSVLCTGAYHQYQVPICFGSLLLLRVLDALTIRFYEFPMEVLKLVQLRYLALTSNGNLPPSISKLLNLQCLIVNQHLSIKFTLAEAHLPVEIWDLRELRYLKIMGRNLPHPPHGAVLPNLLTLFGVGSQSCTEGVLERLPALRKLRVQMELTPDAAEPLTWFDHFSCDTSLYSLQFFVVNPKVTSQIVAPLLVFPHNLGRLTLSGFGYPWIDMKEVAKLPCLSVLKLQCYAFRGDRWELESGFPCLEQLIIEDTDLVRWTIRYESFRNLRSLTLKNCYKLQEIPYISTLRDIQLADCNPSAVACAIRMAGRNCKVSVDSSWEEGNLNS